MKRAPGLYCERQNGHEYWYIGYPRAPMRVDKHALESVVFLAVDDGGKKKIAGTAFAISVRDSMRHGYFVTARHCIDGAKEKYEKLFLRLNRRDGLGAEYIEVTLDWAKPEDPAVDIAVLPIPENLPEKFRIGALSQTLFGGDQVVDSYHISVGDDVLIMGLFAKRAGQRQNVPIVRAGTIAAMPDEPLHDRKTGLNYRGFLLEVRSTGGLSGSPVIAHLGYPRGPGGKINEDIYSFIIGVVRGHWDYQPDDLDGCVSDGREDIETLNTGIAIATPFQAVWDLLQTEDLVKQRRDRSRSREMSDEPTLDWADEDESRPGTKPERLKIDAPVDEAIRKMFESGKPPDGEI